MRAYPGGPERRAALAPGFSLPLPEGALAFSVLCLWMASHPRSHWVSLAASPDPPISSSMFCGAYLEVHMSEFEEEEEEEEGGREDEEAAAEEEEGPPEGLPGTYLGGGGLEGGAAAAAAAAAAEDEEEGGREEEEGGPDFSIMS